MIKKNVGAFTSDKEQENILIRELGVKPYCGKINGKSPHRC